MDNTLFTSLRKYRPTEARDPIENFLTEALAWILKNHSEFSHFYLAKISDQLAEPVPIIQPSWETQANFGGFFPDLVCHLGDNAIVFEHKVWSHLHDNQLENYRSYARSKYATYKLVLITANTVQHGQDPDVALCWRQVHSWISEWLEHDTIGNDGGLLFKSLLHLIEYEGMGPIAPISHESIMYALRARDFERNTGKLVTHLFQTRKQFFSEFISPSDFQFYNRCDWGRVGLELHFKWRPCIFIGVLADWTDHAVPPILELESPDFVVLLSFEADLHDKYPFHPAYKMLVTELSAAFSNNQNGWQFYNHLEDDRVDKKNRWHPLYVRKPLIDVLRGTKNFEEQEERFLECAKEVLPMIINSVHFKELRTSYFLPKFVNPVELKVSTESAFPLQS